MTVHEPDGTVRHKIGEPDARNPNPGSDYFFVTGTTGWAEYGVHFTKEEMAARCREKWGDGNLEDDGVSLWWVVIPPVLQPQQGERP